jgi:ABC-type multidrug transport system fused ATPase/permease subunit
MNQHHVVQDPLLIIERNKAAKLEGRRIYALNDKFLLFMTNHVLASIVLFDVALIVPLLVIPASSSVKITLGVISGSWIQWWALPALQRSQNRIQALNDAKAKVDHQTLTYLANMQDEQMRKLDTIEEELKHIVK